MNIAIVYNADTHLKPHLNPVERLCEDDVLESARDIQATLAQRHHCTLIPVGDCIARSLAEIRDHAPDLVFNLCESVRGRADWEPHFALALDMIGIRYCGCDAVTLALTQDKGLVKLLLREFDVPTPAGFAVGPDCCETELLANIAALLDRAASGHVIIKPSREDGGIGVDASGVVNDPATALDRCRVVWANYRQPALVETFIDGKEYNLALYASPRGLVTLPPGEIVFAPNIAPEARIVGWKAKWSVDSAEYLGSESRIAHDLDAAVHAEITSTCQRVAALIGMDGYCRFDLRRAHDDGRIYVIDINPNPALTPDTGFRKALAAAGIPFADFLDELIHVRKREPWQFAA